MKKCEVCKGNSRCWHLTDNDQFECCFCSERMTYGSKFWENGYWQKTPFGIWCDYCRMKIDDSREQKTILEFVK